MKQSSLVPVLLALLGALGLLCLSSGHRNSSEAPASSDVVATPLLDEDTPDQELLSEEEQSCHDLVHRLGGDQAILIRREVRLICGTYPRPEGVEFVTEASKTGGSRRVTGVSISRPSNPELPPDVWRNLVMQAIVDLPSLRQVSISSEILGDADISQLKKSLSLRELRLCCPITDSGLGEIGEMHKLKSIAIDSFGQPRFTDLGLEQLRDIPRLELALSSVKIEHDIFSSLENLSACPCRIAPWRPRSARASANV